MTQKLTRRQMLSRTALGGAGVCLIDRVPASETNRQSPNEKLNIAVIGCGGRGAANLAEVAGENIVALCDVDERRSAAAYNKYSQAKKFHDFRQMLDRMDKQIDAVVISAPNHIHAPASLWAMTMGKHCYCEKPLTHSVAEVREVTRVAAAKKVATQMGTQIHASSNFRRIVELVQSGVLGPIQEVRIRLPSGGKSGNRPTDTPPVPPELKWDLWLGPAPHRPYHPCYVPHDWHYWWDFGGGQLANMGCHYLDLAFWALKLRHPTSVEAHGAPVHTESTPDQLTVTYQFAARDNLPPVQLTWDHGRQRPPFWDEHKVPDWAWGVFVGSKGKLLVNYDRHALWPESQFAGFQQPKPTIPESIGHHQEWITACKTGSTTTCPFDYAGVITETVLLGNVAYRSGTKIHWDAAKMRVTNVPDANEYLARAYRVGWTP